MKRILLALALVAAVLAVPATAAAFSGVVVAKNPARHAVVVASRGGVVRTVRATPKRYRTLHVGQRLAFSAKRLHDGTFRGGTLHARGVARHVFIRATVVRQRASRYLLSAGGTLISVRTTSRRFDSATGHHRPGDIVGGTVHVGKNGLTAGSFKTLGHEDGLELEGIFLSVNGNQLRLAVEDKGEVFVTIPAGFQLPALKPGDEIELVVSVDASGAFTLVSVQTDEENGDGDHEDHGRIEAHGQITDLTDMNITVQSHNGSPVTCAIPAGFNLSGFKVNDQVEMKCALVSGQLTLVKLKSDDDEGDDGDDDDGGDDGGGGGGGDA
jgi:hypothetical protein